MRSLILLPCFIFTFMVFYSPVSYGSFSYDIDRFTVVSDSSPFVDEFDDGVEPPNGPSGPSTYESTPFSADAESGGMLNLNSIDAVSDEGETFIDAFLPDIISPGIGGSIEGRFDFSNGINPNTAFRIEILSPTENGVSLFIESSSSGNIYASVNSEGNDLGVTESQTDISNSLIGVTKITLRLDVSSANVVTASLDFESDGTFDITLPGTGTMFGIVDYWAGFGAEERVGHTCPVMDQEYNPGAFDGQGAIGSNNVVDWSQTFTVGISGTLTSVELNIYKSTLATNPLLFDIRTTSGGTPTEPDAGVNILASKSIAATDVPTTFEFFSISGLGVSVTAGDILAITLRSDDPDWQAYNWVGTGQTLGYTGGSAFVRAPVGWAIQPPDGMIHDLSFRTFVEPAAAPTDTDGDGIPDCLDVCPDVFGEAVYDGCPTPQTDQDGDGILDEVDLCPDLFGSLAHGGCPEPSNRGNPPSDPILDLVLVRATYDALHTGYSAIHWDVFPRAWVLNRGPETARKFDVHFSVAGSSRRVWVDELAPGATIRVWPGMDKGWFGSNPIGTRSGDYILKVVCDSKNRIPEFNEGNNVYQVPVVLRSD